MDSLMICEGADSCVGPEVVMRKGFSDFSMTVQMISSSITRASSTMLKTLQQFRCE